MNAKNPDIYQQLAKYLDNLPAGYPPTTSGVEIQILQKLFSREEAALALHLTLLNELPGVIARRAGQPQFRVSELLAEMAHKGIISSNRAKEGKTTYAISQFVVGFYEDQVNRLDKEMAELFEAYAPTWFKEGPWKKLPQIRTIPINQAIPLTSEVMPYEQAKEILQSRTHIAVRNCICRQERELLGKGCDKPLETCLSFDSAAENTVETGKGRMITLDDALEIIEKAQAAGLVLQPANSKDPIFMCTCCACCCGVLRHIKMEDNPGDLVANPYVIQHRSNLCINCGNCVDICPMDALITGLDGDVELRQIRCIGCGLCISVCPTSAVVMTRKPSAEQPRTPNTTTETYLALSRARGIKNTAGLAWGIIKSKLTSFLRLPVTEKNHDQ